MKICMLPALNGDCLLVEYVPSHYILIDGGYVDTYQNHLLPMLKGISERGGVIDAVVVTHIDSDHISGIIKLMEEMPVHIGEIWYNGYRHIQSAAKVTDEKETFVHRNICKESQSNEAKPVSAKQGCTLSALIAKNEIPWNLEANEGRMEALFSFNLGEASIHILSPGKSDIENLEHYWKKRLIKDGLLSKAHSEEYWDDAFEFCLCRKRQERWK